MKKIIGVLSLTDIILALCILLAIIMLDGCNISPTFNIRVLNIDGGVVEEYHNVTCIENGDGTYRIIKPNGDIIEVSGDNVITEPENNN